MIKKMDRPKFMLTASTATRSLRSAFPASRVVNLLKTLPASVAGAGLSVVFHYGLRRGRQYFFLITPSLLHSCPIPCFLSAFPPLNALL